MNERPTQLGRRAALSVMPGFTMDSGMSSSEEEGGVEDAGGRGRRSLRVGSQNFSGFNRMAGGYVAGCMQVEDVRKKHSLNVLAVTEHRMCRGTAKVAAREARRRGMGAFVVCADTDAAAPGKGVGLFWDADMKEVNRWTSPRRRGGGGGAAMAQQTEQHERPDGQQAVRPAGQDGQQPVLPANQAVGHDTRERPGSGDAEERDAAGRWLAVEFAREKGERMLVVAVYGVSDPSNRREQARAVFTEAGRCIRDFRKRQPGGGVVVMGDFNCVEEGGRDREGGANRADGVDVGLGTFVRANELQDAALQVGAGTLEDGRPPFTFRARREDGGASRIDRVYVGGNLRHRVATSWGAHHEPAVRHSDHGLVGCMVPGRWGVRARVQEQRQVHERVNVSGAAKYTHPRSKGVPTFLEGAQGAPGDKEETVAWLRAGGYDPDDLCDAPALDGRIWLRRWMEGGMRKGGLATPGWVQAPGGGSDGMSFDDKVGSQRHCEQWVKWREESWAKHAWSRGRGWPEKQGARGGGEVSSSTVSLGRVRLVFAGEVRRKDVNAYLRECGAPEGVAIAAGATGKRATDTWEVAASEGSVGRRWLLTYGREVGGGLGVGVMRWATGWVRFTEEVNKQIEPDEEAPATYEDMARALTQAGTVAFGTRKMGGKSAGGGVRGEVMSEGVRVLHLVDRVLRGDGDRRGEEEVPAGVEEMLGRYMAGVGADKAAAGHALQKIKGALEEELQRATRAIRRRGRRDFRGGLRRRFAEDLGGYLDWLLGGGKGRGGATVPRDAEGERLMSMARGLEEVARQYSEWCPAGPDVRNTAEWWEEAVAPHRWIDPEIYKGVMNDTSPEEVMRAHCGGEGKAAGPSGITRAMWKYGGPAVWLGLSRVYNEVLRTGEWPRALLEGIIFPICKKAGPCVVSNARPIALLETAAKGLTRIIAARLKTVLTEHPMLEHSQTAFLPGVDILDNIQVDSFLWDRARAEGRELHVAYMDCSKAYDSMKTWHTEAALRAHRLPEKLIGLLTAQDDVEGGRRIVTEDGLTEWMTFPGMAQGEVLSPLKFVYAQDPLARWLSDKGRGVRFMGRGGKEMRVVALQFCDDLNVYGETAADLQHNVGIVAEWCRVTQMKMNGAKSAYMTTAVAVGDSPEWSPTMRGTWQGGRGGTFRPDEGGGGRLLPKAADESVRTLGVWRASSGCLAKQGGVLRETVESLAERLWERKGGVWLGSLKYTMNCVLIPRLAFPLRDASQHKKGLVEELDAMIRVAYKGIAGLDRSESTCQLYADERDGGHGLMSLQDVTDRALLARAMQLAQPDGHRVYWEGVGDDRQWNREAARRRGMVGTAEEAFHTMRRRATVEHDIEDGTPWVGGGELYPGAAKVLGEAMRRNGLTMERSADLTRGRGEWLEGILGEDAVMADWSLRRRGLLWTGDLATKDGMRIKPWRQLQWEGVVKAKGERRWYRWVRRVLCGTESCGILTSPVEPLPPEAGDFALCWEDEEEAAVRREGRGGGGEEDQVRAVVRVIESDDRQARVEVWYFRGGGERRGQKTGGKRQRGHTSPPGFRSGWIRIGWCG